MLANQMTTKSNPEYDRFKDLLRKVVSVPHSEIKEKLDAEKRAKAKKKAKQPEK